MGGPVLVGLLLLLVSAIEPNEEVRMPHPTGSQSFGIEGALEPAKSGVAAVPEEVGQQAGSCDAKQQSAPGSVLHMHQPPRDLGPRPRTQASRFRAGQDALPERHRQPPSTPGVGLWGKSA